MNIRGFSLVELMIVVVIIGVLATTAVPLYGAYIDEAAESEARVNLVEIASKEEANYAVTKEYIIPQRTANPFGYYTKGIQPGNAQWERLGFGGENAEGGVFGGPVYYVYTITSANAASTYTVQAERFISDNGTETLTISHESLIIQKQ